MSETVKTSVFAAVAMVVSVAAFAAVYLGQPVGVPVETEVGEQLFPEFKDPLQGASLEIVRADEELAKLHRFEVEQGKDGRWVIPSHGGYPADAENRIRDAAVALMDLKIMGVATDRAGDHELFGVVEPTSDNASKEGVGTLLAMQDSSDKDLVRLIVGQKVKGQDNQRFVRKPSQDRVYAVEINLDAFPAKFEDWIEKDLLQLNPLDLAKLNIQDYSAQAAVDLRQGVLRARDNRRMDLAVSDDNGKWKLDDLKLYRNGKPQSTGLLPEEELNQSKLNDVKNGLDTLEIVDVRRKPQGLGADLKADQGFLKDQEGVNSLVQLGFIPDVSRTSVQQIDLYAANGEVLATLKDGVEYVLKFGNVSGAEEESENDKLNRYLLVMARVNESAVAKPELAELPPLPEEDKNAPTETSTEGGEEAKQTDEATATETADVASVANSNDETSTGKSDDDAASDASQDDRAKIEAERERITKENQRKLDEYNDKIKEAQRKVRDLNFRFADWYYVVSEDVFKKVRLTRSDVIQEKASVEDEGFGVDAFRSLEEEGLKKPESPQ